MQVGYVHYRTEKNQKLSEIIRDKNVDMLYIDINNKYIEYSNMINNLKKGDIVYIYDFTHIAKSLKELVERLDEISEIGSKLICIKENLDTSKNNTIGIIKAINRFENKANKMNTYEGIEKAKIEGKYKGRKRKNVDQKIFLSLLEKYNRREITKIEIARILNITRPTLDKLISERNSI